MAYGIETRSADNKIQFTSTDRQFKLHSTHAIPEIGYSQHNVSVPGMVNDGTWFAISSNVDVAIFINTNYFSIRTNNYWLYPSVVWVIRG